MATNTNVVPDKDIERSREIIGAIRYGNVNIIVQDGRIVQIDRNEKIRITESTK